MRSMPLQRGAVIVVSVAICFALLAVSLSSPVVSQDTDNARSLEVTVSAESTYVSQGESVPVDVTIQNTGDESSPAPVFDMDELPSGWTVSSWSNADATYRSDTTEWLWTEIEGGEQEQLRITLQASETASDFSVSGELTDGYDNTANGEDQIVISSTPSPTPGDDGDGGGSSSSVGGDTSSGTSDTTNDGTEDTENTSDTDNTDDVDDTDDGSSGEPTDDSMNDSTGDDSSGDGTTDSSSSDEETSDDEIPNEGTTDDGTPGFGAIATLVALIAAALIATLRES